MKFDDLGVLNLNNLIVSYFINLGVFDFEDLGVHSINNLKAYKVDLNVFDELRVKNFICEILTTRGSTKFDDLGVIKV